MPVTRIELYNHALTQLAVAFEALDQAYASLKTIELHREVESGKGIYRLTLRQLVERAEEMLNSLKTMDCEDCSHKLSQHAEYGCEHDRGDGPVTTRDGGTLEVALGPCGCEWGLQEVSRG